MIHVCIQLHYTGISQQLLSYTLIAYLSFVLTETRRRRVGQYFKVRIYLTELVLDFEVWFCYFDFEHTDFTKCPRSIIWNTNEHSDLKSRTNIHEICQSSLFSKQSIYISLINTCSTIYSRFEMKASAFIWLILNHTIVNVCADVACIRKTYDLSWINFEKRDLLEWCRR